jgi:hypothetical protein
MSLELSPPRSFSAFPFDKPYDIQNELMHHLYIAIEKRHVTLIESPTGTVGAVFSSWQRSSTKNFVYARGKL